MTPLTFQIGAVRVHLVSDGVFWVDGGTAWGVVPRALWEKVIRPDDLNRIPMRLRCLLVESSAGPILVDTGYGDKLPAKQRGQLSLTADDGVTLGDQRLAGELAALGVQPKDVTLVVDTHLHADHCGGNTTYNSAGEPVPAFPHATYLVQRLELADASYPNERTRNTYYSENFTPLIRPSSANPDGVLRILYGDTRIAPGVRTWLTPGHTRAHQAVVIESQGETGIFLADAAAWAVSLEKLAWVPAFDVEPLASIETKRSLRDWIVERDVLLFFQHDISVAAGRLRAEGDRWRVEPVAETPLLTRKEGE